MTHLVDEGIPPCEYARRPAVGLGHPTLPTNHPAPRIGKASSTTWSYPMLSRSVGLPEAHRPPDVAASCACAMGGSTFGSVALCPHATPRSTCAKHCPRALRIGPIEQLLL